MRAWLLASLRTTCPSIPAYFEGIFAEPFCTSATVVVHSPITAPIIDKSTSLSHKDDVHYLPAGDLVGLEMWGMGTLGTASRPRIHVAGRGLATKMPPQTFLIQRSRY
jgi:hypothetical protein